MGIKGTKKRFDYFSGGNRQWIEKIDELQLASVTPEMIVAWKKKFIAAAGTDVIVRRRATVSGNSLLRQAKSLFSKRKVLDKLKSVELPAPFCHLMALALKGEPTQNFIYGCGVEAHELLRAAVDGLGTNLPES